MEITALFGPLVGGLLVGAAASALLLVTGRVLGVSGIVAGLLMPKVGEVGWRFSFVAGLVVGGVLLTLWRPDLFVNELVRSLPIMALGGVLVGFGARLGSGCTSGHGVCGVARFGPRSLVATVTFITAGAVVTFMVNHFFGGAL